MYTSIISSVFSYLTIKNSGGPPRARQMTPIGSTPLCLYACKRTACEASAGSTSHNGKKTWELENILWAVFIQETERRLSVRHPALGRSELRP